MADSDTEVEPVVYNIDTTPMKYFRILISRHGMVGSNGAYYSAIGELELYGELSKGETMTMDINKPALILNPGETDWLKILGNPGKVEFAATYSSSDENVVKVDADGTVTAVANGTAVITATANESGKSYTCAVTVEEFKPSSKFQIVAFIPYFYGSEVTETTFDNLKNGGITNVELNFALDDSALTEESVRKALELAYARGLDVTVSSKQFSNVTWPNKSETQVLDFVKQWSHLPGVAAFYITDEPASSIPYARAISLVKSVMPYAVTHINYCGAYEANVTELQKELTKKYGISLDYVMYDAYTFRSAVCDEALLYSQLIYNHNISKKLGIPGACYIQSMAWNNNHRPNGDEIRYQVFASLACGIKQISYFCWKTPRANSAETYGPAVIDIDNNPTDLFEPVSEINAQVQALGPTLMKLEFFDVYHTGKSFGSGYNQLPGGFFLQPVNYEDKLAISHLEDADGQVYSMVVNRDYKNGLELKFTLSDAVSSICRISDETGEPVKLTPDSSGVYTVSLKPGEGVLLQADASYKYDVAGTANFYYLNKAIAEAEKLDLAAYKEEGKDNFLKQLEATKKLVAEDAASQDTVDAAKTSLINAMNSLKPYAADGVNLALHKDVDAPNSYQEYTYWAKDFLTDGINVPLDENTNAGWSVDPNSKISRDDEVTVTVDLEEAYLINTVILKPCIYNSGETMPSDFKIQLSADGSSWTDVASVKDLELTEALDQVYTFDYTEGRYVRVLITRGSAVSDATGAALSQLGELEVYGREVADGVPEPTENSGSTASDAPDSTSSPGRASDGKANPLPWIIGGAAVLAAAGIAAAVIIKKKKVN